MSNITHAITTTRRLAGFQQQCFRAMLLPVLAIALTSMAGNIAYAEESLTVSPISSSTSGAVHNGKIVWVDLVTTDPEAAVKFYTAVFGWTATHFQDKNYIELNHGDNVISSVVRYEDGEAVAGDARWLVSISVADVDAAAELVAEGGGEILEPATDLPDRGRYAVVSDPQGAVLMLLRATGGDPADSADSIELNEWAWAELWTDDPDAAVSFYKSIAGYGALRVPEADGDERIVLGTEGKARATVVKLPWDDVEANWVPYIPVANVVETLQQIVAAGGAVMLQAEASEISGEVAIVVDPTGGVFAVQQMRAGQ